MKVLVFGSSGMLGRYVSTYLNNENFEVVNIGRNQVDASETTKGNLHKFISNNTTPGDVIINCMGVIKPVVEDRGEETTIRVNSIFPRMLADLCEQYKVKLIHPTTDCVYTGEKGNYSENDPYDVSDVYGMSKALGEPKNCTVIRTSIIGEEIGQSRSLIEWIKSNKGGEINGFEDHIWNGVTCLQFAKICQEIINENLFWQGIKHVHSNSVNKYELLNIVNDVYELGIKINKVKSAKSIDRSISSIYSLPLPVPSLQVQIQEMSKFSL